MYPKASATKKGRFICEYTNEAQIDTLRPQDAYRLRQDYWKAMSGNRFQVKVRSVELNVNQRCSSLLASAADVQEAESSGRTAVEKALQGETGKMVTCSRLSGPGYELEYGLTEVGQCVQPRKILSRGVDHGGRLRYRTGIPGLCPFP